MKKETLRKIPYLRPSVLSENLGICRKTVYSRIEEIENNEQGRYGQEAVIFDGKICLVNIYAFLDYLKFRKYLSDENLRKYAPEYDPSVWARSFGEEKNEF